MLISRYNIQVDFGRQMSASELILYKNAQHYKTEFTMREISAQMISSNQKRNY